jgi:hypothetical protein
VKGQSGNLKVSFFPFLHFFLFYVFFCLCVFFSYVREKENARRKHLKQKCKSKKTEAGAKSEKGRMGA